MKNTQNRLTTNMDAKECRYTYFIQHRYNEFTIIQFSEFGNDLSIMVSSV